MGCLKCGDTGMMANGDTCSCGIQQRIILPDSLKIPVQYQNVRFSKLLVREELRDSYGNYMESLLQECTENLFTFHKNIIICAPPNSGKTVWAYTVCGILYAKNVKMPEILDIMQLWGVMTSYYRSPAELVESVSNARLAVFKIPLDLPSKFIETISTVIERRVRNNSSTIFMYSGRWEDLVAQDTFGKLK